jgi:hypothetical protein
MDERQLKGLFYNCGEKYFSRHKCKEKKLFMAIFEDVAEDEIKASPTVELPEPSPITPPSNPLEVELVISLNALTGFSTP